MINTFYAWLRKGDRDFYSNFFGYRVKNMKKEFFFEKKISTSFFRKNVLLIIFQIFSTSKIYVDFRYQKADPTFFQQ